MLHVQSNYCFMIKKSEYFFFLTNNSVLKKTSSFCCGEGAWGKTENPQNVADLTSDKI